VPSSGDIEDTLRQLPSRRADIVYGAFLAILCVLQIWWFCGGWPLRGWLDAFAARFPLLFAAVILAWGIQIVSRERRLAAASSTRRRSPAFWMGVILASLGGALAGLELAQPLLLPPAAN